MDYNRFKELRRKYNHASYTYHDYMPEGWRKLPESFIKDPEKSVIWNREYVAENNRKFEEYDKIAHQKAREECAAVKQELLNFCMETLKLSEEKVEDLLDFCEELESFIDNCCDMFEFLGELIEIFEKEN